MKFRVQLRRKADRTLKFTGVKQPELKVRFIGQPHATAYDWLTIVEYGLLLGAPGSSFANFDSHNSLFV